MMNVEVKDGNIPLVLLIEQLNAEGKDMALEYMQYLVSTGKYCVDDEPVEDA